MTDANFKALCETHNFLAGIPFSDISPTDPSFWDKSNEAAQKLRTIIEDECPLYFAKMQARWNQVTHLKSTGASREEIATACDGVLATVGER